MSERESYKAHHRRPLCVFCLSPAFSIRVCERSTQSSASRRSSIVARRRDGRFLPFVRPRFKPFYRRASNCIPKYLAGALIGHKSKPLSLQEVLNIVQEGWKAGNHVENMAADPKSQTMEEAIIRKSSNASSDMPSPILLRRRLSAPETIMRKHMLAQQQSDSQDSESTQSSYTKSGHWRTEMDAGSDSNLNRKRDSDLMRKSTLIRRLWNKSSSSSRFSGTFYEWQHSCGKLSSGRSTHSLTSVHSSPEHLVRSQSKRSLTSLHHKPGMSSRKMSPTHANKTQPSNIANINNNNNQQMSPKRKLSASCETHSYADDTTTATLITTHTSKTSTTATTTTFTPKTENSNETKYTTNSATYTNFSYNSDSAYTNSNYSNTSSNNNSTPSEARTTAPDSTHNVENNNNNKYAAGANESSTQTLETTKVNVISNVQLSQSTLDLIFNQVMQDVQSTSVEPKPSESQLKTINVQQVPSFYLKQKEDSAVENPGHKRIVKYMISNVGTGSPYSKPAESPQVVVPRFSALPRTISMEVNISSGDSTDKESDTVSLVDSLEDPSSFRSDVIANHALEPPLPDNSDNVPKNKPPTKPTSFYIPIEIDDDTGFKAVSDHLPDKVRNRLVKRQQRLQAKNKHNSPKSDIFQNPTDSGEKQTSNTPHLPNSKHKKRSKPLLPTIESFRRIRIDRKPTKEAKVPPEHDKPATKRKPMGSGKSSKPKLSPLYTSKNEYIYDYGPRRIYHKTEFNNSSKRIEILEIMECVDSTDSARKPKSKIPVLVSNPRLPKLGHQNTTVNRCEKPAFLDLNNVPVSDPKLDQLIANILIDTLNSPDQSSKSINTSSSQKSSPNHKYKQKFEVIPEEMSLHHQSSAEDAQNHDLINNNAKSEFGESTENANAAYQGKAAVAVVKDENFSSIPKGWITFYMLHKNRGSPDSTSDEGKKLTDTAKASEVIDNNGAKDGISARPDNFDDASLNRAVCDLTKKECLFETNDNFSSSSDVRSKTVLPPPNLSGRYRKYSQRKQRHRNISDFDRTRFGEWSVTVSGTNSYGQFAPDLEMSLKFPESHKSPSQSDSGLGEDNLNEKKLHRFPLIDPRIGESNKIKLDEESEDSSLRHRLPEIARTKLAKRRGRSESGITPLGNIIPPRTEPRQTRTSTRRYNLNRPKIEYPILDTPGEQPINLFDERHYAEILARFPEILKITGNAIQQRRPH